MNTPVKVKSDVAALDSQVRHEERGAKFAVGVINEFFSPKRAGITYYRLTRTNLSLTQGLEIIGNYLEQDDPRGLSRVVIKEMKAYPNTVFYYSSRGQSVPKFVLAAEYSHSQQFDSLWFLTDTIKRVSDNGLW